MVKKWIAAMLAVCLLIGCTAMAERVTTADLRAAAQADFPDWRFVDDTWYGSGMWYDQMAMHYSGSMVQIAEGELRIRGLYAAMDPLKPGDPVPWEIISYAPVPLTAEAEARLAAMEFAEIFDPYENEQLREAALPGCADFLLNEGEHLTDLLIYPDFLVATVEDGEGRGSLRIGHWDGTAYTKVTATAMGERVWINAIHSWNDGLELWTTAEMWADCDEDGVWRLTVVTDGGQYFIGDGYLVDDQCEGVYWTNAWYAWGVPTFPTLLDGLDFAAVPVAAEDAAAMLDAAGFACTAADGVILYDAPEGSVVATCYARLTGKVIAEEGDWVQLQIGSAQEGMTGWFRREDVAFGAAVSEVRCGFPSYDMPDDMAEGWYEMWLIAELPGGGWLAQIDVDRVEVVPAEKIGQVGPACDDWGEMEEIWAAP